MAKGCVIITPVEGVPRPHLPPVRAFAGTSRGRSFSMRHYITRAGERKVRTFYRMQPRGDGLVDIWLTPGEPVPFWKLDGRVEFRYRLLAVQGINPEDPQWGGNLEAHIREHYGAWIAAAEEVEI